MKRAKGPGHARIGQSAQQSRVPQPVEASARRYRQAIDGYVGHCSGDQGRDANCALMTSSPARSDLLHPGSRIRIRAQGAEFLATQTVT